jgi:putative addiction module component (TIGR02574 family)
MSLDRQKIESDALKLPSKERAQLAHRLIVSLDDDTLDQEWADEVVRRKNELLAGDVDSVSEVEVLESVRRLLR